VRSAASDGSVGLGRYGLSLLISGRWFVGGTLNLALAFFVLLFFARDLALALLK
jgi:hypothetical protein